MTTEELIQNLTTECQKDPTILGVILFGSYARGENYRDVDICLVPFPDLKGNSSELFKIRMKYEEYSKNVLDINLFYNLPLYIQSRVVKEGKILLDKNYDLFFDLYLDTIKQYTLFEPHLNTYLKAVLDG